VYKSMSEGAQYKKIDQSIVPITSTSASINKRSILNSIQIAVEDARVRLKKFLSTNAIGQYYNQILLVFSVISCIQFIYQTYEKKRHSMSADVNNVIELIFSSIFLFDWCLSFFVADNKAKHITRYFPFVCIYNHCLNCAS
jgi:hypothetical protein